YGGKRHECVTYAGVGDDHVGALARSAQLVSGKPLTEELAVALDAGRPGLPRHLAPVQQALEPAHRAREGEVLGAEADQDPARTAADALAGQRVEVGEHVRDRLPARIAPPVALGEQTRTRHPAG